MQTIDAVKLRQKLSRIRHIVIVLSGKGGVGKSTVACLLAAGLSRDMNLSVGLCDIDLCGPSIPTLLGLEQGDIRETKEGWNPCVVALRKNPGKKSRDLMSQEKLCVPSDEKEKANAHEAMLRVISIGFLLSSPRDAVIWRGPRKDAMIRQFLSQVNWGNLDVLIMDTPPGTSDEHITLCEVLGVTEHPNIYSLLVTTPQQVALDDVRKMNNFCEKLSLSCMGVVENMSGYRCPSCATISPILGQGGGELFAKKFNLALLGILPLDPTLSAAADAGKIFFRKDKSSALELDVLPETQEAIQNVVSRTWDHLSKATIGK